MELFNLWQTNLVAYLFFLIVFFQSYKLSVRSVKRDGTATVLLQLLASLSAIVLSLLFSYKFPTDPKIYLLLLVACIFYAINDRFQTTARKNLQVSVYSIIGQLANVFLIIIGLTVFGDGFVPQKILGAGLILFANIFLFFKKGSFKLNKYAWTAIAAAFFFSIAISTDIGISRQFNLPFYIMLTFSIPSLFIFVFDKIKPGDIVREFNGQNKSWYLITGVSWTLTTFFSLRAYQLSNVETIVPLGATSVLLNVLVAYFFLGEKSDGWKKITAAIIVIIGICLTVI
ncbi:MAG TPA: EamA family transporter [Patescibacteria group bacterium]|nr:EamA family transporter [Patescibacteria group bacterium]